MNTHINTRPISDEARTTTPPPGSLAAVEALQKKMKNSMRRAKRHAKSYNFQMEKFQLGKAEAFKEAIQILSQNDQEEPRPLAPSPPWMMKPLNEWAIVGMNHYHINGEKRLFVAMVKDGRCIKEEGPDDKYLWNRLWHKATQPNDKDQHTGSG